MSACKLTNTIMAMVFASVVAIRMILLMYCFWSATINVRFASPPIYFASVDKLMTITRRKM